MADKIIRRVQADGQWFGPGDEAKLAKSSAQKNHFERWRIEGVIEGFEGAGKPDKYETDAQIKKRQPKSKGSK